MDYEIGDYLLITIDDQFENVLYKIVSQIIEIKGNILVLKDIWVPKEKEFIKSDKWNFQLSDKDQYAIEHFKKLSEEDIYKYLI